MILLTAAATFFALVETGETSVAGTTITGWWPGAGLLVGTLTLATPRWWPPILVAGLAALYLPHLAMGDDPFTALTYCTALLLGAVTSAAILQRGRGPRQRFDSQGALLRLVAGSLIGGALSGGTVLLATLLGLVPNETLWRAPWNAFSALGAASLILVPLVLPPHPHPLKHSRFEALFQWISLTAVVAASLALGGPLAALVLPLPLLIWGAYRVGLTTTVQQVALYYAVLCQLVAQGIAAFATQTPRLSTFDPPIVAAQAYLVCVALICLPAAMAVIHGRDLARDLRAERDLSDMTLNTAGCLVIVTDMSGTLLRVNRTASRLLGVSSASLIGTPAWHLVGREQRRFARRIFSVPDGSSVPSSTEGRMIDHTGHERRLLWTSGIVRAEDGTATHVVLTGLDVTAELNAAGHTEHLLRAPIDTAIVGIDKQGRITLVNSGAEAVLGRSAQELVGTPFVGVLSAAELAEWARGFKVKPDFASLLAQAVDAAPRDWHWLGDRTSRLVSMELSRIIDDSGTLIGYLCVANDVTEIRTRQQLLVDALDKEREAVDRLRELDATKDHFVTTVSHELRTPVATIVGYTEMLTAGELGDLSNQQVKAMTAVNRNAERLVTLVDNLLALAGVSGDSMVREPGLTDLNELAEEAERQIGSLLQSRRLTVIFEFPGKPVLVAGERRQLGLALSNLLSNSIKFTEDGGEIRCRLFAEDDRAVFEVIDNGLGIPEEEQHQLFVRFWRSTTAINRHIQGTGLGLATAQAIIAAHGGWITITSAHLAGTKARVSLPLEVGSDGPASPRAERSRRERSTPLRPRSPGLPELTRRGKSN